MLLYSNKGSIMTAARKLLSILLVIVLLLSMGAVPVFSAEIALIQENFDSYSPGNVSLSDIGWTYKGSLPTMTVVNDTVTGRTYASLVNPTTGSSYAGQSFENQTGGMFVEFDINIPGSNGGYLFINSGGVNSTTKSAAHLAFDKGILQRRNSTVYLNPYDTTDWYHYKIYFNIPKKKLTLTITDLKNNTTVATSTEDFITPTITGINSFGFSPNKNGGQVNIDNLRVTKLNVQIDRLAVSGGTLTDGFEYYYKNYNIVVPDSSKTLNFTPATTDDSLIIDVAGNTATSGGTATVSLTDSMTSVPVTVSSSVYTDVYKTYTFSLSRLGAHPNLENVESEGRDSKVMIGWTEPEDPTYVKANIYQVNATDNSLKLADTVPKGKYISEISGLTNETCYIYIAKAVFTDNAESTGVTVSATPTVHASRQMESLTRGLVAMKKDSGIYVGWRLLGTDPVETTFNLYRDGVKVNSEPIADSTNYLDVGGDGNSTYYVRTVLNGQEQMQSESVKVWSANYISVPLQIPEGGMTVTGQVYTYSQNEASVGDLDGDGQYEIVMKWSPSNQQDNGSKGITSPTYLDAYKLDGTLLWRINCGINIRSGSHYNQFIVYDLDGDGKAEVALKTADGTVDGQGNVIGDPTKNYVNSDGFILDGPEYLTVFRGKDGKAISTTDFIPGRGTVADWGDSYGNRVDRFLGCVAYLDGVHPSLVMTRGYYTRMTMTAYDFKDGVLTQRWAFDSNTPGNESYYGQGNHQLSVADVDGDGKDEIVTGAACIDDNGTGLWSSGLGHGDALHVGDLDPNNLGLEVWAPQEETGVKYSCDLKDARTGKVIFGQLNTSTDTGRALTGDIDPRYPGEEMWVPDGSITNVWEARNGRLYSATGELISTSVPSISFGIWWDGDLSRELADHDYQDEYKGGVSHIDKWDYVNNKQNTLIRFDGFIANGTKGYPLVQADLFGDWREEIMLKSIDSKELRIFSTTDLTKERIYTLMQDPEYRLSVAWQNVAYNQPPHPSFYLGNGMEAVPQPKIYTVGTYAETQVPTSISGLTTTVGSSSSIDLSWTAVNGVEKYNIYRGISEGSVSKIGEATTNTFSDSGLAANTTYYYRVTAIANGLESDFRTISAATTPEVPTGLRATAKSNSAITLSWVTVSGAASYNIYRGNTAESLAKVGTSVETSYEDTSLSYNTNYYYYVTAVNNNGESEASGIVTAKTEAPTYFGGGSYVSTPVTIKKPTESERKIFNDVTDDYSWAREAIEVLSSKGIINGTSDNTFAPEKNITRADFMLLLVKVLDLKADVTDNFKDAEKSAYYYEALGIAKKLGIATGVGDNLFNPAAEISRQDMMVLCARALELSNKLNAKGNASELLKFSDNTSVASYAKDGVAAMVKEGIVKGNGNDLNPLGNATRAEVAVIMYRIFNK